MGIAVKSPDLLRKEERKNRRSAVMLLKKKKQEDEGEDEESGCDVTQRNEYNRQDGEIEMNRMELNGVSEGTIGPAPRTAASTRPENREPARPG